MRGVRILKLLLILFVAQFHSAAGQSPGDSVDLARKISRAFKLFLTYPDSSIHLAEQSLAEAQKEKYIWLEGYSYYTLSKAHWTLGNFRLSIEYGFKALKVYEHS